jgi:hypothetical protein
VLTMLGIRDMPNANVMVRRGLGLRGSKQGRPAYISMQFQIETRSDCLIKQINTVPPF